MGLYHEILQGDHRALYLAWLRTIQDGTDYSNEFDDETVDPPVPPGLEQLLTTLDDFCLISSIACSKVRSTSC